MCGIVGIFSPEKSISLEAIVENLKHRGPDEQFQLQHITKYGYVSFGATRLAVINTRKSFKPKPNLTQYVLLNGEIWNFPFLAKQLEIEDPSASEQDILLAAYHRWGMKFTEYLDGMYAIGIVDLVNNQFVIARDPVGIKPLFYMTFDQGFAFASDIKSLVQMRVKSFRKLNYTYFLNHYVFRFSDTENTILPGVHEMPPGTVLTYSFESQKLNKIKFVAEKIVKGLKPIDTADAFEHGLAKSIMKLHRHSDTPRTGLLLSGGIDSSLVAVLSRKMGIENIVCFFVGSEENPDYKWAKKIAQITQYPLYQLTLKSEEVIQNISDICYHHPAILPGAHIFITFQKINNLFPDIKVVLCGEGADELLGGYPVFRESAKYVETINDKLRLTGSNTDLAKRFLSLQKKISTNEDAISLALELIGKDELIQNHLIPFDHFSMSHGIELRVPYLDLYLTQKISQEKIRSQILNDQQKCWIKEILERNLPPLDKSFYTRPKIAFPNVITHIEKQLLKNLYYKFAEKTRVSENWMLKPLSKIWIETCYSLYCEYGSDKNAYFRNNNHDNIKFNSQRTQKFRLHNSDIYTDENQIRKSIKLAFPLSVKLRRDSFFLNLEKFLKARCESRRPSMPHQLFKQFVVFSCKNVLDDFYKELLSYEYSITCIVKFPGFQFKKISKKFAQHSTNFELNKGVFVKKFKYDFVDIMSRVRNVNKLDIAVYRKETLIAFHPEASNPSNKILKLSASAFDLMSQLCTQPLDQIAKNMNSEQSDSPLITLEELNLFVVELKQKELLSLPH